MTSDLWSIYQGGRPVSEIAPSRVEAKPLTSAMYNMVAMEEKRKADGIQEKLLALSTAGSWERHERESKRGSQRSPDSSSSSRMKRKFREERPNQRWAKKYDRPLPQALMELCLEEECRLCGLQISSMVVMQQHYEGKTHAKKVAAELERMHQANPEEPVPKKMKVGDSTTDTFLAHLAGSMELPLTPRQEEQRDLYSPPLPADLVALLSDDQCGVCSCTHSSEGGAIDHYNGKNHIKKMKKVLGEREGEWV